jgi:hypothetical protein
MCVVERGRELVWNFQSAEKPLRVLLSYRPPTKNFFQWKIWKKFAFKKKRTFLGSLK